MKVLLLTWGLLLVSFLFQVLWFRTSTPQHQIKSIFLLFITVLIFGLLSFNLFGSYEVTEYLVVNWSDNYHFLREPWSSWDNALVILLYLPTLLIYMILYGLIESNSPSLLLVQSVFNHKGSGVSVNSLLSFVESEGLIEIRLKELEAGGYILKTDDLIYITSKGKAYFYFWTLPRRWIGREATSG